MNVILEEMGPCRKRLKIEVPADRVGSEVEKITKEFGKQARIPGFRKGKAPKAMIEKRFGREIEDELKRALVPRVFDEAVRDKKLKLAGRPHVEDLRYQSGMSLSFSAVVDLVPDFSLPDYKSIKIEKVESKPIDDADVDKVLEATARRFADYKTVGGRDVVQEGDFAVMDYSAEVEAKPLKEALPSVPDLGERKNFWLLIKPGAFLPGFADQLIGAKTGEPRDVSVTFPDDFGYEELRGKTGVYHVTVGEIKEQILPEINDEFTQKHFQLAAGELRKNIRADLESRQAREIEGEHIRRILEELKKSANFDLPESLVRRETQRVVNDIVMENQRRGISEKELEENKDKIFASAGESAREHVKVGILLERIAEAEKIEVTEKDLNIELHILAHRFQMKPEKLAKEIQRDGRLGEVEEQILHRKTVAFLVKTIVGETESSASLES